MEGVLDLVLMIVLGLGSEIQSIVSPVWMLSVEFHLSLLDRAVHSAQSLYEGQFHCLGHRRRVSALCLLYEFCHKTDHPLHEYMHNFVAARNTRASAALGELALVITRCNTEQLSRSFLPVAVRLWNLLHLDMFSGGTFSSFKSTMNFCLVRAQLDFYSPYLSRFLVFYCLPGITVVRSFWFLRVSLFLILCTR